MQLKAEFHLRVFSGEICHDGSGEARREAARGHVRSLGRNHGGDEEGQGGREGGRFVRRGRGEGTAAGCVEAMGGCLLGRRDQ